jgi:FkbM family methyltransferase
MTKKIIYDIGANIGDNIPYYLLKADKVVAVEANPILAKRIRQRFANEIANRILFVENVVATTDPAAKNVPFFIHKMTSTLSQFPPPDISWAEHFREASLPSKSIVDIIEAHGTPYYIKIDIEHYDHIILKHLFLNNIRPPYLSTESHSIDSFCLLVSLGGYNAYKLVDGESVAKKYANHIIDTLHGSVRYSFPYESAGPFGNDIVGTWMTKDHFFDALCTVRLGWKDIHVSNVDAPDPNNKLQRTQTRHNTLLKLKSMIDWK